jgi:oligopeptide/dipeptide ABC transporter, ATP-binding protein, C-terminal domain
MENVLTVKNLKTYYYAKSKVIPAVDGVSFGLQRGQTLGIVGESGCGKSTVARSLINLLDTAYTKIVAGEVIFHKENILTLSAKDMSGIRGKKISMIFQNPLTSLNPVYVVGDQLAEILMIHEGLSKKDALNRGAELLKLVGIPAAETRLGDYPHQLSGGMQQRVMIAIALACNPEVLIADEPTTALDVTIQAQILDLITRIKKQYGMGMILISHNMGVVAEICDKILVMYGGVVVEEGVVQDIFASPRHPYTKGLLASIPSITDDKDELLSIAGSVPRFSHPVRQCRFASRCSCAEEKCLKSEPPLFPVGKERRARCWQFAGIDGENDDE